MESSKRWQRLPWFALLCLLLLTWACQRQPGGTAPAAAASPTTPAAAAPAPEIKPAAPAHAPAEKTLDPVTGLVADKGYLLVRNNCGSCHSYELIRNKRATREGWLSTIRWMQRTQGLWDLGDNEKPIIDYLAKNYAPEDTGRRKQLTDVEWYKLEQ